MFLLKLLLLTSTVYGRILQNDILGNAKVTGITGEGVELKWKIQNMSQEIGAFIQIGPNNTYQDDTNMGVTFFGNYQSKHAVFALLDRENLESEEKKYFERVSAVYRYLGKYQGMDSGEVIFTIINLQLNDTNNVTLHLSASSFTDKNLQTFTTLLNVSESRYNGKNETKGELESKSMDAITLTAIIGGPSLFLLAAVLLAVLGRKYIKKKNNCDGQ